MEEKQRRKENDRMKQILMDKELLAKEKELGAKRSDMDK